jgi:hypothetical protein
MGSHVDAHRLITLVTADLWRELLEAGCLNDHGLEYLRARLDTPGEFEPDYPAVQLLRLDVDAAYAKAFGIADPNLLPGREPLPDTPGDLPPPSRW